MKKTLLQTAITVLLFFSTWLALKQINWVKIFQIEKVTDSTEEKIGELYWSLFKNTEIENKNEFVITVVDSLISKICIENNIAIESIKPHILNKDEINAFALPDGHLIIYSELILNADNQEELSGVICHEIAHIQHNHVMQKLMKEVGLSVLVSMTTGSNNSDIIKESLRTLSSSAFDRSLEEEADETAVDYLINAKIDPKPFADFLYKLALKENETTKYLSWVSTHPESKERAKDILNKCQDVKITFNQTISIKTWNDLKEALSN